MTLILITSVILQLVAAILALRLIRVTGGRTAWIFIAVAILLMAIRRCLTLAKLTDWDLPYLFMQSDEELVALLISILMVLGIACIEPLFHSIKRSKEALKVSEANYRAIFNAVNDTILVHDTESGNILDANQKLYEMYGYTPKEAMYLTVEDISFGEPPYAKDNILQWVCKAVTGKPQLFEWKAKRKDGSLFWVEVNLKKTIIGGKDRLLAVIRDINDRKLVEEKLKTTHRQLLDIIEFLPDATFVVDDTGKVIAWNRAIEEMSGIPKENIIGKNNYIYHIPFYGRSGPVLSEFIGLNSIQSDLRYDYIKRKENTLYAEVFSPSLYDGRGAFLWIKSSPLFDSNGNLVGAIESIRDITEHKRAESKLKRQQDHLELLIKERTLELTKANEQLQREVIERKRVEDTLRRSENRFSKAFNSSPSLMAINTLSNGKFVDVNESFLQIIGYSRNQVIGRSTKELNLWAEPKDCDKVRQEILEQGSIRNLELEFCTKSGQVRMGLLSAETIDLGGEQCILGVMHDITDIRQLEKEMARFDRLNLIGEMAAGIAHEIRNPMTSVRGFCQMLGDKKECIQYEEYFDLMINELDRANSIITEFLSLAKDKVMDLQIQNLNTIVKALFPLIQADAMETDMFINVELQDVPDILLDEKEIRQLILNLVRNGLEAMSPGKNLTIRTFMDKEDVVLSVQDRGEGIAPDLMDKIGTPFLTTKKQGTGLGLAICYSIAARHNADINVESDTTGTTFFVRFRNTMNWSQRLRKVYP